MATSPAANGSFDVARFRAFFPSLADAEWAFFDGPGGTQTPTPVGDAIAQALTLPLSNRGATSVGARNADRIVLECRSAVGDLLGIEPDLAIHGRSATALNYHLAHAISADWTPGDEVVVTRLDHDSNVRPWIEVARRTGAVVRWVDFDPETGELTADAVSEVLSERTRIVALTAASNLIGTIPDVAAIAEVVHRVGGLVYVDGVHYAAHHPVDMATLGADFFVFSPYKLLGPHCAFATGRRDLLDNLRPEKLDPSSNALPERFELGTLPYEQMAGVTAAIDFVAAVAPQRDRRSALVAAMSTIDQHEGRLLRRIEQGVGELPGVTMYSRALERTPTVLFTIDGMSAATIAGRLGELKIAVGAGAFYCDEGARHLGLSTEGAVRVGVAPYNDDEDVDRLLDALVKVTRR
ncbi:cysteine desulfurase-like protein [Rhodococcoides trifolii]|uniref:Cysteine desulfurase-like protein n=1 Tax=Rhodococcoides trifolii TaxID=908250 RepID=A0A917D332_9NOCA|nr:cysteine desulfurase-like protein [Rhodococcus trifolii]GGG09558.1 cysteine desulfurase-like protein [Rhodococcus trifolii]